METTEKTPYDRGWDDARNDRPYANPFPEESVEGKAYHDGYADVPTPLD